MTEDWLVKKMTQEVKSLIITLYHFETSQTMSCDIIHFLRNQIKELFEKIEREKIKCL